MYDYVIVGAGSAGCVLANRLSEDPDVRVLLVEAGPPDTADFIHIPAAFSALFRTQHDWDHMTGWEPGAHNRRIYLPRGRMLGGSSSLNAMIYMRGNPLDYDAWRDAGCTGWGWDDLLPYFKRAEDNERGESEFHGAGGPLPVSEARARSVMCQAFLEAADALGLPRQRRLQRRRAGRLRLVPGDPARRAPREHRRRLPAPGHGAPEPDGRDVRARPQGRLRRHARDRHRRPAGGRAARVARRARGDRVRRRLQLAAAADAVGHRAARGARAAADPARGRVARGRHEPPGPSDRGRDLLHRGRVLAQGRAQRREPRPVDAGPGAADVQHRRERRLRAHARRAARARRPVPHGARSCSSRRACSRRRRTGSRCRPACSSRSRAGWSRSTTPDPTAKPFIVHGYYTDPEDVRSGVAGMRMVMDFVRQAPLSRYAETPNVAPASDDDAELERHMRQTCQTIYHPTSTCRMGAEETSVVDPELRVRGVEALRVVDASVMPSVPRGNTNAPVIAIAERAADLIRGRATLSASADRVTAPSA